MAVEIGSAWVSLLAFVNGSFGSGGVNRRGRAVCALESASAGRDAGRLDSKSLRHLAAQFVVVGTRESRRSWGTERCPVHDGEASEGCEDNEEVFEVRPQSALSWSWLHAMLPVLVENLKDRDRREQSTDESLDLEKLLPAPLFQSLFFTWDETMEEEKASILNRFIDVPRSLAARIDNSYRRLFSSAASESLTTVHSANTVESTSTKPASLVELGFKVLMPFKT